MNRDSTFHIVKRKDEAKFNGDYRTKRVILEIYDALAESMQTGKAYQIEARFAAKCSSYDQEIHHHQERRAV